MFMNSRSCDKFYALALTNWNRHTGFNRPRGFVIDLLQANLSRVLPKLV